MDQSLVNFMFGIISSGLIGFTGWIFRSILKLNEKTNSIELNYKDRFAKVNYNIAEVQNQMNLKFEELKHYATQENITTRHNIIDAIQQMQLNLSENFMTLEGHEKMCRFQKKEG